MLRGSCASTERGGIYTKPAAPVRPLPRLLLGDYRGPAAVAAVRPVVAVAWGTAAVSALPFLLCPSLALHGPALHGPCERERHEDRQGVGVVLDDFGETGRGRDGLAVFRHVFDMQGEYLSSPLKRLVEAASGGDRAGKVREGNAVVGIGVFVDEGDVVLTHVLVVLAGCWAETT